MSVVDSQSFTSAAGCSGKQPYKSLVAAQKAADRLVQRTMKGGGKLNAYCCPNCGDFHIGRPRNNVNKKRELQYQKGRIIKGVYR